jgi:predicted  nucleic acid-binding Zn-ribbon protein
MSKIDQQKTTWEHEIDDLKKRNKELYEQQHKLEEELRPHREREYKEKERLANEKRAAESEQRLIDNLVGIEALVTKHVKDPLLRKSAFEFALRATMMHGFGPFGTYLR